MRLRLIDRIGAEEQSSLTFLDAAIAISNWIKDLYTQVEDIYEDDQMASDNDRANNIDSLQVLAEEGKGFHEAAQKILTRYEMKISSNLGFIADLLKRSVASASKLQAEGHPRPLNGLNKVFPHLRDYIGEVSRGVEKILTSREIREELREKRIPTGGSAVTAQLLAYPEEVTGALKRVNDLFSKIRDKVSEIRGAEESEVKQKARRLLNLLNDLRKLLLAHEGLKGRLTMLLRVLLPHVPKMDEYRRVLDLIGKMDTEIIGGFLSTVERIEESGVVDEDLERHLAKLEAVLSYLNKTIPEILPPTEAEVEKTRKWLFSFLQGKEEIKPPEKVTIEWFERNRDRLPPLPGLSEELIAEVQERLRLMEWLRVKEEKERAHKEWIRKQEEEKAELRREQEEEEARRRRELEEELAEEEAKPEEERDPEKIRLLRQMLRPRTLPPSGYPFLPPEEIERRERKWERRKEELLKQGLPWEKVIRMLREEARRELEESEEKERERFERFRKIVEERRRKRERGEGVREEEERLEEVEREPQRRMPEPFLSEDIIRLIREKRGSYGLFV